MTCARAFGTRSARAAGSALLVAMTLSTSVPAQAQVQEALAAISFIRSLDGGGGGDDWIRMEFNAINLKLDHILENQERVLTSIIAVSDQIAQLEKALVNEMRELPYKEINTELVKAQARLRTVSQTLDRIKMLQDSSRASVFLRALDLELDNIRDELPHILETVVGIDASYNPAKYPFLAGISSTTFDLVMGMQMTDYYVALNGGSPISDDDRAWYLLQYQSIISSVQAFTNEDVVLATETAIATAFEATTVPSEVAGDCLFSLNYDGATPADVAAMVNGFNQQALREARCTYRVIGSGINCARRNEDVMEATVSFGKNGEGFMPFDFTTYAQSPETYMLDISEGRSYRQELWMVPFVIQEPVLLASIVTGGWDTGRGDEVCDDYSRVETIGNLRSPQDRDDIMSCVEMHRCPFDIEFSDYDEWWRKYRDVTSLKALELSSFLESVASMNKTVEAAETRIDLLLK